MIKRLPMPILVAILALSLVGLIVAPVVARLLSARLLAAFSQLAHIGAATPDDVAYEIVVLINEERRALDLEPLTINDHLVQMAQWRSQDMIDGGYVGHDPPPGHPTLMDLCERLGHSSLHRPDENIITTQAEHDISMEGLAGWAVEGWRNSPGHWRLIVSPSEEMTGVGVAVKDGRVVITQLFWAGGAFTPADAELYNRETP